MENEKISYPKGSQPQPFNLIYDESSLFHFQQAPGLKLTLSKEIRRKIKSRHMYADVQFKIEEDVKEESLEESSLPIQSNNIPLLQYHYCSRNSSSLDSFLESDTDHEKIEPTATAEQDKSELKRSSLKRKRDEGYTRDESNSTSTRIGNDEQKRLLKNVLIKIDDLLQVIHDWKSQRRSMT